ncbi:MAG TPA: LemA family protein [Propionibacteriaceae bacterium]|nr:LemA family protein [Propionibacteriaceae bacterium]
MTGFWIVLVIIAVVIVAGIGMVVGPYNRFVRLRNTIQESWRQVDVELNRRYELIPNLVETVKGYAAHESGTLEDVVRLRNQAASLAQTGSQPQRAAVESQLSEQIGRLMVSVEAYPQLQANQNFLELQRQLADTEDRIAAGRRYYNANVRAYNTSIEQMPGNLVANAFHFEKAGYFEVTDSLAREAPTVSFGSAPASPPAVGGGQPAGSLPPADPPPAPLPRRGDLIDPQQAQDARRPPHQD